ncbi:MAG: aminotransferase class V-fold PLP-dependent enzyme, partial [Sphingobacteriales bacterium]
MDIRNEFPALQGNTYLNTAASGILYNSLYQWRRDHDQAYYEQGSDFRMHQMQFLESVKDSVAAFFNADRNQTYLTANFSSAYGVLLDGLPANYRFLLLGHEFPAVYYQVQSRSFEYELLPLGPDLEQRIIERIVEFQPQVFAFSMVQYSNGLKLSQNFLRMLKDRFPDLILIADGTQYLGTEVINFNEAPIDALLGSCYKWMLGGYGCGVALLKESLAQQLYPDAQHRPLPTEAFLKHKTRLALRFEPGQQDTLAFGSLQHSI